MSHDVSFDKWLSYQPWIGGPVEGQKWYTEADMRAAWDAGKTAQPEDAYELPNAIWLAKFLHDTYERLAPQFGYVTREDTRAFDHQSPNGRLMAAVCEELRNALRPQVEQG